MSQPFRTIVVGTDGSITAGRAVDRAAGLAGAVGARLVVAYVGDASTGRTVLSGVQRQYAEGDLDLDTALLTGDPADAIVGLADAEHADLIVVGNKGMTGAQRFLLGSVPNKVSHRAVCDVLIVHTTGRES